MRDITFLIQGPVGGHTNLMKLVTDYSKFGSIVVSTYNTEEAIKQVNDTIEYSKKNNINLIVTYNNLNIFENELKSINEYRGHYFQNHCYYQINTVLNGLEHVKTKYVIKHRTDSYFSNIDNFIDKMKETNKIVCSSIFVRGFLNPTVNLKYCLSDILFGGLTEEIKIAFKLAKKNYKYGVPEVIIWKPYIIEKAKEKQITLEDLDNNNELYLKHMCDIYEVFSVELNKPYSFRGLTDVCNDIKSTEDYFTYGGNFIPGF
jgi:hypothetical protein